MDRTFVLVLVLIFVVLVMFIIFNTIMGEYIVPIFNETASNMPFVNQTLYQERAANANNAFLTAMFIMILIPFIYIFIRILKREPQPYQEERW